MLNLLTPTLKIPLKPQQNLFACSFWGQALKHLKTKMISQFFSPIHLVNIYYFWNSHHIKTKYFTYEKKPAPHSLRCLLQIHKFRGQKRKKA